MMDKEVFKVSHLFMNEHIEEFINHLAVERGLADNTLLAYRRDLKKYSAYLEKKNILKLLNHLK